MSPSYGRLGGNDVSDHNFIKLYIMRISIIYLPLLLLLLMTTGCNSQSNKVATTTTTASEATSSMEDKAPVKLTDYRYDPPAQPGKFSPIEQPDHYWRERLSAQAFDVLRNDGTERPHTSDLLSEKRAGVFTCGGCGLPLFSSETKFKSGTGWPSFYQPIHAANIREDVDTRYGWNRVEVSCARCGGHQGHVFEDGPAPTGLRYCINGVAMDFIPSEAIEPYLALRKAEMADSDSMKKEAKQ